MILHPPVMALSLAALLSAATLSWAGVFSVQLLRHWNLASGARRQIELERRTYLIATTLTLVMALQGFALLLMVFNADAMAPLLIGAMCAFGTFNASVFGFPALFAKMALFFAAIVWLAMNHADVQARDYPLTRRKYALLLLIAPLGLADAGLSLAYFADLKTDTLTSCCGTVFNPEKTGLGAEAAALEPRTALMLLAAGLGLTTALGWLADRRAALAIAYGGVCTVFFGVALAAVVSAVSIYIYENPHHHCPFCLLKREYNYIGFALYAPLFVGAACGLASGVLSLRPPPSLQTQLARLTRQLRRVSIVGFLVFGALCAWAVAGSGLRIYLFDTSAWLAATFEQHSSHSIARRALQQATPAQPAVFCRATQHSFLRLVSTAVLAKTYGVSPLTNRAALATLDALQAQPQVAWRDEPPGVFALWRTLAALDSASPKVWMDAYLAAFPKHGRPGNCCDLYDCRNAANLGQTTAFLPCRVTKIARRWHQTDLRFYMKNQPLALIE